MRSGRNSIRHDLTLPATDHDPTHAAVHCPLEIWGATPQPGPRPIPQGPYRVTGQAPLLRDAARSSTIDNH